MKSAIQTLCSVIKKIILQIKPQSDGFSFVILTGKTGQGKKTLLKQSHYQHVIAEGEVTTDIYYNQHGIILDISESWLHQTKTLLQQTLKQLNRCHHHIKISGIFLCVDVNELTNGALDEIAQNIKAHNELLRRFGTNLGYRIDVAVILTKLDTIAGFCEFYQQEHTSDLRKPLGFSLIDSQEKDKLEKNFTLQFNRFIDSLNQQVLNKIHPARSSIKRTLIREFPLQLASLRLGIQSLLLSFSPKLYRVQSLFFTSAEQGGFSHDQLNQKFTHEYALTIQDKFPLSNNYRAYFIQGALDTFQRQTKQFGFEKSALHLKSMGILASIALVTLSILAYSHFKSNQLLDQASKEWLAFDAATAQHHDSVSVIDHITIAKDSLEKINHQLIMHGSIQKLKSQLNNNKTKFLNTIFIPSVLKEVAEVLSDNHQPHGVRYQALKIMLMLNNPTHYHADVIADWFKARAPKNITQSELNKRITLINDIFKQPIQPELINQQLINDTRNLLNALPVSYLYYSIAKNVLSSEQQPIDFKGFVLAESTLPSLFTKSGFHKVIPQLQLIAKQINDESWVLNRQPPENLVALLEAAYSYDYALWWNNFIKKTAPQHAQNYQEAIHLTQIIRQSNSIENLINLIQTQTSPELGDTTNQFNQLVANQFTDINLLNNSTITPLAHTLNEMEKFLTTISIVNDQGKTAFTLTKSRFQGDTLSNPLSSLFAQSEQLHEPVASWIKQIANDTWFILINDTKRYINTQWQNTVYQEYTKTIANHFPFDQLSDNEVSIEDFNHFFSSNGLFNTFAEQYIKPFLDTSEAQWKPKEINNFVLPISADTINEIIRANVITNMFFRENTDRSHVEFTLQKSDLDPAVSSLYLMIGRKSLNDTQDNQSFTRFQWPVPNAKLTINTLDGHTFTLEEHGVWGFFKLLQKVDVQTDTEDSSKLQVLFEISGNSGRYLLKTNNDINPFTPGVLNGFNLFESIA